MGNQGVINCGVVQRCREAHGGRCVVVYDRDGFVVVAVLPALSLAMTVSVWGPSATLVVSQEAETVPCPSR